MEKLKEKPKVCVVGGSGEFGRVFASFFQKEGFDVAVTGRDAEKGKKVAKEFGFGFSTNSKEAAQKSDIVIISVPIENTVKIIEEVAPHVREGALLMDTTSIKTLPCRAMEKNAKKGVEIIGMHPMFGPRVASLEGNVVILTPVRAKKWLDFVVDFFNRNKAKVIFSTPEEHDKMMGIVQGLTHFSYITIASTIKRLDIDVEQTRKLASPLYELMLDLIARIVGQNPHLYASIQMENEHVEKVHEAFISEAEELNKIVKNHDTTAFIQKMKEAAKIFKDIDAAMGKSDKAIAALTHELGKLKEAIGKKIVVKHIYSGAVHYGRVSSFSPDEVILEKDGKEVKLKISNIELLDDASSLEWKKQNLKHERRDFSAVFSEEVSENVLAQVVKNHDARIISCTVIDVFRGNKIEKGKKSITISVEAVEFEEDFNKIESLLKSLGGKIR